MGKMSSADCEHARGLMALGVLGRLSETEQISLLAHLDGCSECRADTRDLNPLVDVLPAADPAHLEDEGLPAGLADAVLGGLRAEVRRERRSRRVRYTFGAAAAAAVAAVAAVSLFLALGASSTTTRTVAMTGSSGVKATVVLSAEPWGTSLRIDESGQAGGQVMWVSMRTASGRWWQTGTYRTVSGHRVEVDMACALKLSSIESIWVRNSNGTDVLHGYLS
jgi:hypothetical protein